MGRYAAATASGGSLLLPPRADRRSHQHRRHAAIPSGGRRVRAVSNRRARGRVNRGAPLVFWTLVGIVFIAWLVLVALFTPRIDYHVDTPIRPDSDEFVKVLQAL